MQTLNKKKYPNALFIVKVHLAIKLVHMHLFISLNKHDIVSG